MSESQYFEKKDDYDSTINVIGGLKDCSALIDIIKSYFAEDDSLSDLIQVRNELNLRTEKSRGRVERAVKKAFIHFVNEDHKDLIQSIFQSNMPVHEKEMILFWQFALNNRLFREISIGVFTKIYFSGRVAMSKEDIIAYLKEYVTKSNDLELNWSESTIDSLSTKYLNLMTKLNFLEGARKKSFKSVTLTKETIIIFLYFAKLYDPISNNILSNYILPLSFIPPEEIENRLKKLSMKDLFNMNYNGVALNIELTHSYKGICDVLYN